MVASASTIERRRSAHEFALGSPKFTFLGFFAVRRRAKTIYVEVDGAGWDALEALSVALRAVSEAVVVGHDVALTMVVPVPGRGVDIIGHLRVEMDDGE